MSSYLWDRVDRKHVSIIDHHTSSIPVRVGDLAAALGLSVIKSPMEPRISGLIRPSNSTESGFEIRVNKYEVPERQRFTVAHEISHYLLHRSDIGQGVVDSIMYRSSLTSRKETEANKLAADIVMPAKLILRELERLGGQNAPDVASELAAIFRVSVPAMKVRLGIA